MTEENRAADLALVLSGGGARASYQVGVVAALGDRLPQLAIPIITGGSAELCPGGGGVCGGGRRQEAACSLGLLRGPGLRRARARLARPPVSARGAFSGRGGRSLAPRRPAAVPPGAKGERPGRDPRDG